MGLYEENFQRLIRLAPGVRAATGRLDSSVSVGVDLSLEIQEQARYMTLLRLTHFFTGRGAESRAEPDAQLRLYHDACQLEVLELRQSLWSMRNEYGPPTLAHKWRANLFVAKWLAYCLAQGHCFSQRPSSLEPLPAECRLPTCS